MNPNRWWQVQFKGGLRAMVWEIAITGILAGGVADALPIGKYRLLLFPVLFVGSLATLLRFTRKEPRGY